MISRRSFVGTLGGCAAHIALMASCASPLARKRWTRPANAIVAKAPFAQLEIVAPDTWALVSLPLSGDRTTLSNGGIIAGKNGVIAVEGFYKPEGAAWLAERARELTGRWPTHVVLTHYHSDHAAGLAGYVSDGRHPTLRATGTTRELALSGGPVAPAKNDALARAFADVVVVPANAPGIIDLGDRRIHLSALSGHTASDLALIDEERSVTFTGDLMWNGMFPNYVDAVPSRLAASVKELARQKSATLVPGHGAVADRDALVRYQALLDDVEAASRRAHKTGQTAAQAGAQYKLPPTLGEWVMFSPQYFERAFLRWYLELGPQ